MTTLPTPGSRWRETDPRYEWRIVEVESCDGATITYRMPGLKHNGSRNPARTTRLDRFLTRYSSVEPASALDALIDGLFTNGAGSKAERLVLVDAFGGDLGGWSRSAVRDRVLAFLKSYSPVDGEVGRV